MSPCCLNTNADGLTIQSPMNETVHDNVQDQSRIAGQVTTIGRRLLQNGGRCGEMYELFVQ